MRPKESSQAHSQGDLYRSGLEQILSHRHPLYVLAKQMDWTVFEQEFGLLYVEKVGRPGLIERKIKDPDERLEKLLRLSNRLMKQERKDKNKLYSIHAPEVECISKGKAHKRYEFGCKVSMVTTSKGNWIVGIDALHGNPYDGHTFKQSMDQTERITGQKPEHAYSDKGYRGAVEVPGTTLHLTNKRKKRLTRSQWRWLRRRSAIEAVFGHLKSDNRLERNHLRGKKGTELMRFCPHVALT